MSDEDSRPEFKVIPATDFEPTRQTLPAESASGEPGKRLGYWPVMLIAALGCLLVVWFALSGRLVQLSVIPDEASFDLDAFPYLRAGKSLFIRPGQYSIRLTAEGYFPLDTQLTVGDSSSPAFELKKLPGQVRLASSPAGASVQLADGEAEFGQTPLTAKVPAGEQLLVFVLPRYKPQTLAVEITGMNQPQALPRVTLSPNWAEVHIDSRPTGASVWINEELQGSTPSVFSIEAGEIRLEVVQEKYQIFSTRLEVQAEQTLRLPVITLNPLSRGVSLKSTPTEADVLLDGRYLGTTPLLLELADQKSHLLSLQKKGYSPYERTLKADESLTTDLTIRLTPLLGQVVVRPIPVDSEIWVNGKLQGRGAMTLSLPAVEQQITVKRSGYSDHLVSLVPQPGIARDFEVRLLTLDEARKSSQALSYQNRQGQSFRLVRAGVVKMGSLRNEHGFVRDQVRREVTLEYDYYLSLTEVTNRQYRAFMPAHSSGTLGRVDLNPDRHPVVKVSWLNAVRYCNWLSQQEGLSSAYLIVDEDVQRIPQSDGYRLPTEAEWAWAARQPERQNTPLKFPWGQSRLPNRTIGNFGNQTGALAYNLRNYSDGYAGTAPVGSFSANALGLFDIGGNVSEWVEDRYSPSPSNSPAGPETGEYRVVRGSSWRDNRVEQLRLAWRRYALEGSDDIGFRLARTVQ